MAKARGLTEADLQLWAAFSATILPLPGRQRLTSAPKPQAAAPGGEVAAVPAAEAAAAKPVGKQAARPISIGGPPAGLDKSTWKKFASGRMAPAGRIDLHGHTAARAHRQVTRFIEQAHAAGLRCVEVITGKGEVLARELPHWLNAPQLQGLILAVAHPHAANTGSVLILLRRTRP